MMESVSQRAIRLATEAITAMEECAKERDALRKRVSALEAALAIEEARANHFRNAVSEFYRLLAMDKPDAARAVVNAALEGR